MTRDDMHNAVAAQVRAAGTSFYWPMQFQRRAHREALFAIYTYCHVLDDIADRPGSAEIKRSDLESWRKQIDRLFSKVPIEETSKDPLTNVLADAISRFNLPQAPFKAIIDGMERDLNGPVIAPDWSSLQTYCGQVAGAVGDLCLAVWGWRGTNADQFANTTGEALQLTNILRDLKEDTEQGRLYLPEEALMKAEIETRVPLDVLTHPNLDLACEPVVQRAQQCFTNARALWATANTKTARPAWVMLLIYEALFGKVRRNGFGPERSRARLSQAEKLFHLLRAYVTA